MTAAWEARASYSDWLVGVALKTQTEQPNIVIRRPRTGEVVGTGRLDGDPNTEIMRRERLKARCFEVAASLGVLDHPGALGRVLDGQATRMATLVERLFDGSGVGSLPLRVNNKSTTLGELFAEAQLSNLSPGTDQVGRCTDASVAKALEDSGQSAAQFMSGPGKNWLLGVLRKKSVADDLTTRPDYRFEDTLTKQRFLLAVGSFVWNVLSSCEGNDRRVNAGTLASWLSAVNPQVKSADQLLSRFDEFRKRTRNHTFDDPITRTRVERVPLVDDQPVQTTGFAFERNFQGRIKPQNIRHGDQRRTVEAIAAQYGEQAMDRDGAPSSDHSRPGTLSDRALAKMPHAFRRAGLQALLDSHRLDHGPGINRWEVRGTHRSDAAELGFPSAGAQSGGMCDTLLALHMMNEASIYGNKDLVLPMSIGLASFMNFGGYHTFIETLPIAQCTADNKPAFTPGVSQRQASLYSDYASMVKQYVGGAAHETVRRYHDVFESISRMDELQPTVGDVKIFLTPQQHERFKD